MVSRKEDKVDFDKLERELVNAVEADQRYWRENDAKLRAVHQKVATYDEFRDIVLASHLKPLDKSDNIGQCIKQTWNVSTTKADDTTSSRCQKTETKVDKLPSNAHEFSKAWKYTLKNSKDRYYYLLHVGSQLLGHIFRNEISFGLLGEIISVLNTNYSEDDGSEVAAMLQALSSVNRFSLSLQFLDESERTACSRLLQRLQETFNNHTDLHSQQSAEAVSSLMSVYSM